MIFLGIKVLRIYIMYDTEVLARITKLNKYGNKTDRLNAFYL